MGASRRPDASPCRKREFPRTSIPPSMPRPLPGHRAFPDCRAENSFPRVDRNVFSFKRCAAPSRAGAMQRVSRGTACAGGHPGLSNLAEYAVARRSERQRSPGRERLRGTGLGLIALEFYSSLRLHPNSSQSPSSIATSCRWSSRRCAFLII